MTTAPLSIRQNNPGNIRPLTDGQTWLGQTGVGAGFCIFDTMANGLRAVGKNLIAYQEKYGIQTIGPVDAQGNAVPVEWVGRPGISPGFICRWSTTDRQSYVDYVCATCELKWNDKLNIRDTDTLYWMITAIGETEAGHDAFLHYVTDADITAGVAAALA